ncbi:hypothetical protein [Nostoc sp. 'Lobaria pulmonaria (5183) cyanobiont']|uniref:hypothetical protein n=1 Tax=Nostoc sp. 'Lobaria pulmonaria (5183) cyanobiont' TaxID=1618022 RepID=UPI000CF357CA|nr:hypothetical protein [Nostoc sp. 'Lobaria pulmonaria (5183) cyanobiont']AVH74363.1 hypothetical protein NLP_20003 [Nostoc sp. 'Lobaria pulmonaria (5183) cyanobiont']
MTTLKDPTANFQLPLHNEAAFEKIREAIDYQSTVALAAGGLALGTGGVMHPLGWLIFGLAYKPLVVTQKLVRLQRLGTSIFHEFENEGVQVFPTLPVENNNPIDLFVRFPRTTHLFISIRSKGDREIVYNEAREVLQVKRKDNNGLKLWNPCPLVELADYEKWLNKNKDKFLMTSREAQKTPTAKVLVLCPPTKASPNHKEHLYTEIGDMRVLVLRRKGSAFVITESEVNNFVRAWLSKYK